MDTQISSMSRSARGGTPIEPPLMLQDTSTTHWDKVCDVLIVGWGAAGASAALEAKASGADVIVVDRFTGGGASAKSGGVVYAGGGTRQQIKAGFKDTPEAMFEYLKHETQGVISDATLKRFCAESSDNLAWLESKGAPYSHEMPPTGKTSYPADGYYLYYSGNEQVPAYQSQHEYAPRGHRTVGKGHGGKVLYHHLQQACIREGVQALTQSVVRRLVIDHQGAVIGAEVWGLKSGSKEAILHARWAKRAEALQNFIPRYCDKLRRKLASLEREHASPILVKARKGVLLSTGGFIFNRELLQTHAPFYRRNFKIGATGCDGSGLRLGQSVHAATDHLQRVSAWRFINPPVCWPKGVVVNKQGKRFCNEEVYGATLGHEICEHQAGKAWLILDKKLRQETFKQCLFGGYWWFQALPAFVLMLFATKGRDTKALASKLGMNVETLKKTLADYNLSIETGKTDPLGKSIGSCQKLNTSALYAIDISVTNPLFPLGALTLGGLKVNEETGQVLDQSGLPITGLYAAGRAAVGIPSNLYISGLSLADCVFSGRRAGRSMSQ